MTKREQFLALLREMGIRPEQDADESEVYVLLDRNGPVFLYDGCDLYATFAFDDEGDFIGTGVEAV